MRLARMTLDPYTGLFSDDDLEASSERLQMSSF
jgi:hypothetical protein